LVHQTTQGGSALIVHTKFFTCVQDRDEYRRDLKTQPCPFCDSIGLLICHGFLYGNGTGQETIVRGCRFLCSNRGACAGCGRTYSILLADRMPRSPVPATRLWDLLREILGGKSRAAAARDCDPPFQYSTAHRFLNRLDLAQDRLRGLLCRLCPAPSGEGLANALCQCIEHLRRAFAAAACPITAFVLAFQQPFLE
jgi:hypothetical protein